MTDNDNSSHLDDETWDENERFHAWRSAKGKAQHRLRQWASQMGNWCANAEDRYLALLRGTVLVIATLAIAIGLFSLMVGTGMRTGNPDTIDTEAVVVSSSDIVIASPEEPSASSEEGDDGEESFPRWQLVLPEEFRDEYWAVYSERFAPHYREGEDALERDPFFESLFPDEVLDRISALPADELEPVDPSDDFRSSGNPLWDGLASTIRKASETPEIENQLSAYQGAERVRVCRTVQRTRTRYVEGWDRYSISCPNWYEDFGCATRRAIREPYTERVCSMQFPGEISNPHERMEELQLLYFSAVEQKIEEAHRDASDRRDALLQRKRDGAEAQTFGLRSFAIFLAVMFLYTVISIERHHRLMARHFRNNSTIE